MSRTDDVINVAGHRLCTGAIEEVIQALPEVVECAVFGAADALKGHVPVALLVLKNDNARSEDEVRARLGTRQLPLLIPYSLTLTHSPGLSALQIKEQVIADVRSEIGSFVCLKSVAVVPALPKTRSGKVMRATIQAIADSRKYRVPATIENEAALVDVRAALQAVGYAETDQLFK